MNNIRNGPNGGRGDPPWMYYGSRGDPSIETGARGHPPEIRNTRDGPPIANATRGKPPELKIKRNNSFNDGLISRTTGGQKEPHGRGMPEREGEGRTSECPLPEGNGKGYHPDLKGNKLQRGYSLPSALAFDRALTPKSDGYRNSSSARHCEQLVPMEIGNRRERGNLTKQQIASYLAMTMISTLFFAVCFS